MFLFVVGWQTIEIARNMTALHAQYADYIYALALQSTVDGTPINRPLWWLDPLDPVAQTIDSGFSLFISFFLNPFASFHETGQWIALVMT